MTVRWLTVDDKVIAENLLQNCQPVNHPFVSFSDTKSVRESAVHFEMLLLTSYGTVIRSQSVTVPSLNICMKRLSFYYNHMSIGLYVFDLYNTNTYDLMFTTI